MSQHGQKTPLTQMVLLSKQPKIPDAYLLIWGAFVPHKSLAISSAALRVQRQALERMQLRYF